MLDGNTAGVEENQEDDRPVERLLLHHTTDYVSEKDSDSDFVGGRPILDLNNPKKS